MPSTSNSRYFSQPVLSSILGKSTMSCNFFSPLLHIPTSAKGRNTLPRWFPNSLSVVLSCPNTTVAHLVRPRDSGTPFSLLDLIYWCCKITCALVHTHTRMVFGIRRTSEIFANMIKRCTAGANGWISLEVGTCALISTKASSSPLAMLEV